MGRLKDAPAIRTIDAQGRVVAPGFIDMLGQSDLTILVEPTLPSKIFQGITTEITGEEGSAAPLSDAIIKADRVEYDHLKLTPDWRREAGIPVEIWHVKAAGKRNWGRMKDIVAKIEKARRAGVDITADTYAYPAWFNSFSSFVPPWAHAGGDEKLLEPS